MISKKEIKFGWLLGVCSFYLVHLVLSELEAGSCSATCQNSSRAQDVTSSNRLNFNRCSCTLSCKVYDDCCYDSQYRNAVLNISSTTICLSLLYRGEFKAVSHCPSSWKGSPEFCMERFGHFPPVTSRSSGVTYGNIYCAICNKDTKNLAFWNVELRCCPEHDDDTENLSLRRFVYEDGYLQSVMPRTVNSKERCICKYEACGGDYSFMDLLELRACNSNTEISRCSSTFENETVRELCTSFTEPVYTRHKTYRNVYCAQCNYENLNLVQCIPDIIKKMIEDGVDDSTLYNYCLENNLQGCVQYFGVMGRGRLFSFRELFNINVRECIPPRCCEGYRHDFRTKSCRKLD